MQSRRILTLTLSLSRREALPTAYLRLSGLRHKYDDVRCAQFGLWRGARRGHPRPWGCNRRATKPQAKFGATRRAAGLFAQTSLLAPHRSTAGYARGSRLVWAKNPLPRTSSYLCLRPLRAQATSSKSQTPSSKEAPSSKLKNRPALHWPRHLFSKFGV